MKEILFIFIGLMLISTSVFARKWKKIDIPGAYCAKGKPYSIYLNIKDNKKLAIEMMGGGACWSHLSCRGIFPMSVNFLVPNISNYSKLTKGGSILVDHSMVYFPYCTGDIYSGKHITFYKNKKPVFHTGYSNVIKAIKVLKEKDILSKDVNDLVVYGSSAGSFGALIHGKNFGIEVSPTAKKTMFVDSPGLHWTPKVFDKFSAKLISDFDYSFKNIGIDVDRNNGLLASQMDNFCQKHNDWKIGFLSSDGDFIMSRVFGRIKSKKFKKLVYSEGGILTAVEKQPNCSAWIHPSITHTFLLIKPSYRKKVDGMSARGFVDRVYSGDTSRNYVKKK
jgi:hypothetical protein